MQKQFKNVTIFLLLVLMVVSLYMISADTQPQARELSYMGEFRPMVTQGQIASVEVRPQGNDTTVYTGKLKNGTEFYTQGPTDDTISALQRCAGAQFLVAVAVIIVANFVNRRVPVLYV